MVALVHPIDVLYAKLGDRVKENVSLAPYTSARIGGPADILITAESADELARTIKLLQKQEIDTILLRGCPLEPGQAFGGTTIRKIAEDHAGLGGDRGLVSAMEADALRPVQDHNAAYASIAHEHIRTAAQDDVIDFLFL